MNGAEQVICATGFRAGFRHDPLLAQLVDEHELETEGRWIVLADDSTVPGVTDATRTLALAGVPGQWAFPAADTLVGMKVAARRFSRRGGVVSYTLRGRIETRLAAALLPILAAAVAAPFLHKWWPLELAGLMLAIGLALDVAVYHRLLPYQPGWLAVPLGCSSSASPSPQPRRSTSARRCGRRCSSSPPRGCSRSCSHMPACRCCA